ncbi:hypothetical protein C8J57DRAFT_1075611 [Mycena rebaudengoi]|nr:hypothetical protein C8J57DRAFT_1075611 [Mycena rebaudengoi]
MREEAEAVSKAAADVVEALADQVRELAAKVDATTEAVQSAPAVAPGVRSYAAAVTAPAMTAEQAGVMARTARMHKQILVDKAADAMSDSLGGLTEVELKEKANLALEIMEEKQEGAKIVGARKLVNGGVVFDCIDDDTAKWIKDAKVMSQFVGALGSTCVYRPRRMELIAEMVPVEVQIEEAGTWRLVEKESGLQEGDVVSGRWVKAIVRRAQGQRVAHARVEFATCEAANHAIDNGLFLRGVRVRVRKTEDEAKRCMKCQKYDGHLAHACKSTVEVCGRCAANHRTNDCVVLDSGTFKCSNCDVEGHGAVDRRCPVFQREQERRRA